MGPNSFEMMNDTTYKMSMMNKAKQWTQEGNAGQRAQSDSLLGMAAASLFDVEYFARTMLPGSSASLSASAVNVNPKVDRPRPEEITSQVLAELAGDLFDDDLFDSTEFEPLPIRQGSAGANAGAFRRNSLQQYQHQYASVQSRFSLLENTLNQILTTHESAPTPHHHRVVSQPPALAVVVHAVRTQVPPTAAGPGPAKREFEPSTTTSNGSMEPPASDVAAASSNKKQRTETPEEAARRFRPYQAEQWSEKFEELCAFKKNKGHCCVPHTFTENPALARWVKRQRYQYKLKNEGKQSTMTDERVIALDKNRFIWDSHGAAWLERWNELCDYQKENGGNCNVPSNFPENHQLATWVKCQRRQYKLYWDGKTSNMTLGRIAELEKLGFEWELRSKNNAASSW